MVNPKVATNIHFDIHRNVNYFTNNKELRNKLKAAIGKNKPLLFTPESHRLA